LTLRGSAPVGPPGAPRRRRILVHCQYSTGIGHFVRSAYVARALAERHDVVFLAGGYPFPGSRLGPPIDVVQLAPLRREGRGLVSDGGADVLARVLADRRAQVAATVARVRPDVLITEHFPFSRWSLAEEITGAIEAARALNPGARVICSLRDVARKSGFDTWDAAPAASLSPGEVDRRYGAEVIPRLAAHYDALLVHGDPRVTRLEEQISWAREIPVPVSYTGYVSGPGLDVGEVARASAAALEMRPFVVLSAGGGAELASLARPGIEAWRRLGERGLSEGRRLVVFAGPFMSEDDARALARMATTDVVIRPFTTALGPWMRAADASLSRAGYNTCVDVLAARARAVLVPSDAMVDQRLRARRLAEMGLALVVDPEEATAERIAAALLDALARPRPEHDVALDGAARTAALIEGL